MFWIILLPSVQHTLVQPLTLSPFTLEAIDGRKALCNGESVLSVWPKIVFSISESAQVQVFCI